MRLFIAVNFASGAVGQMLAVQRRQALGDSILNRSTARRYPPFGLCHR